MPSAPRRRARSFWPVLALSALSCGGGTARAPSVEQSPEQAWLAAIGTGAEQNEQVCASGARDRVALALCAPGAAIQSLDDLYRALRLGPSDPRRVAATAHSLSLSGRSVSAANPRVMVFADTNVPGGFTYEGVVATAFARGQQLVELVGLDPTTYEYNFYLLSFHQACNAARCTPADLLGPSVESGWVDWTLYSDADLEDTPLNCSTCHRPFGAGTHKQLLMRQVTDPWMHWGDFRGGDETMCPEKPPAGAPVQVVATADGLDLLRTLEGETGTYAGVPVAELHAAKSGDAMSDFLVDAELLITASPLPPHPYGQLGVQTRETLCERFYIGESPSWERDRRTSQAGGFPFPYYAPDVLDPERRSELLAGREALWQREHERDAFEVAASWFGADVPAAVGFVPRAGDTAPDILLGLCVRCHAAATDPALARARFNAEAETIEPATFNEVSKRLALPASSPKAMPPRPAGELPVWAQERLLSYLAERCAIPGACRAPASTPPAK